jgi:hypothetical protein
MSNEIFRRAPLASPGNLRGPGPPGRLSFSIICQVQKTQSQTEEAVEWEQISS